MADEYLKLTVEARLSSQRAAELAELLGRFVTDRDITFETVLPPAELPPQLNTDNLEPCMLGDELVYLVTKDSFARFCEQRGATASAITRTFNAFSRDREAAQPESEGKLFVRRPDGKFMGFDPEAFVRHVKHLNPQNIRWMSSENHRLLRQYADTLLLPESQETAVSTVETRYNTRWLEYLEASDTWVVSRRSIVRWGCESGENKTAVAGLWDPLLSHTIGMHSRVRPCSCGLQPVWQETKRTKSLVGFEPDSFTNFDAHLASRRVTIYGYGVGRRALLHRYAQHLPKIQQDR